MSTPSTSRKPLRTLSQLAVGIITLFFLIGAVLFFFTDSLLIRIVNPFLAPAGVELRSIDGLRFRRESLGVQSVSFSVIDTGDIDGATKESRLEGMTVTFNLGELLKGRLETIAIKALSLNLPPAQGNAEPGSGATINMTQLLASAQSLPLTSLNIERFTVTDIIKDASLYISRNSRAVAARIRQDDLSADLVINWHDDEFVSAYFIPEDQLASHHFPSQTITGSLTIANNGERVLDSEFTVSEKEGNIRADSTGTLHLASGGRILRRLELLPETLSNLEGSVYFSAAAQGTSMIFEMLDQSVQATLQSDSTAHVATLAITQASADCTLPLRCSILLSSMLTLPTFRYGNVDLSAIDAVSDIAIALDNTTFNVALGQGSRIGAARISGPDYTLEQVNLLLQESLTISTDELGNRAVESNGVELFLPVISLGANAGRAAIKASDLRGRWPAEPDTPAQFSAQLDARAIGVEPLPFQLRKPEISAQLELGNNNLSVDGRVVVADRDILTMKGDLDLTTSTAQIHAEMPPLQFGTGEQSLAHLFLDLPVEVDVVTGSVAARTDIAVQVNDDSGLRVSGPIQLNIDKLSGFYTNTAFVDFSTDFSGELMDSGDFVSPAALRGSIASVNPGLPIENISFGYSIDTRKTTVDLRDLQASIFNGTLRSEGVAYNWEAAANTFTMALERIDLSTLLDMGAYEGVQASGLISGNIPVNIAGSKLSVAEGTLHVEAPGGSIRYQSENSGSSGNAALDLVNQALSNYQYDSLEADVNYLPSGDLNLAVRLQGANPDMNQGQRINLNLNISDNIPSLLQSLQSSRSITDALERALQNQ